jgi:predicted GIY-YIG superfamily endonuclease
MSYYVYRIYDDAAVLLYIGCTVNAETRVKYHRLQSPWGRRIARWTSVQCDTEEEARAAEAAAIRSEMPRWNIEFRSSDHPDGDLCRVEIAKLYPDDAPQLARLPVIRRLPWHKPYSPSVSA